MEAGSVLWYFGCDRPTQHELRYRSDPEFTGKLLVCETCGKRIEVPLGGRTCSDC